MAINGIAVGDFSGLHDLKRQAQVDAKKALPEVAKQFETIFLQSMMKSMRMGQHFIDQSSPFRGKHAETFQDMLDDNYASNIASGKGIGFASALVKQLTRQVESTQKAAETEISHKIAMPEKTGITFASQPAVPAVNKVATDAAQVAPVEVSQTITDFVKSIWPYAKQAASMLGLDPKLLVAQAALETGWGKYVAKDSDGSTSNNFFNIKATDQEKNNSVKIKTTEFIADTPIKLSAFFKKYPTIGHSFNDYVSLIKGNSRYEDALTNADNPKRYVEALHEAGYATDPDYASKIMSIYNGDELNQIVGRVVSAQ
ncbi:flagellar assembly peptidoglycan hydrolase FlgJ [Legionella dresdenensis]|uniref:Peptidoglycan hydrolase FlgJ n=1 Tax=Legionella dresdenensis TaxID=450200 RepID=A0ABV8CBZ8_9GAMM